MWAARRCRSRRSQRHGEPLGAPDRPLEHPRADRPAGRGGPRGGRRGDPGGGRVRHPLGRRVRDRAGALVQRQHPARRRPAAHGPARTPRACRSSSTTTRRSRRSPRPTTNTAASTCDSLVMITVGTGIGGGIVIDGRAYRGATGAAGEIGHTLVTIAESIPAATALPPARLARVARGRATCSTGSRARPRRRIRTSALGRRLAQSGAVGGPDAVAAADGGRRGRDRMRRDARAPRRRSASPTRSTPSTPRSSRSAVAYRQRASCCSGPARAVGARVRAPRRRNRDRDPHRPVRPAGRRPRRRAARPQRTEHARTEKPDDRTPAAAIDARRALPSTRSARSRWTRCRRRTRGIRARRWRSLRSPTRSTRG